MEAVKTGTKQTFKEIISKYEVFFFDCDGVIWEENKPIKYAIEALREIQRQNKKVFIITNASAKTRSDIQEKLASVCEFKLALEQIYVSSYLTALYLKNNYPELKKIYVLGSKGLNQEIKDIGFQTLWSQEHDDLKIDAKQFEELETDPDIGAVVVGIEMNINFYKLSYASICLQKGAVFVASNEDANVKAGKFKMPGGGTIVKGLAHCSERMPYVAGKPNPYPIEIACKKLNADKTKCLMVGDRLDTDIELGINAGIDTLLVLTGVTNLTMLELQEKKEKPIIPTYYLENLGLE